MGKFNHKPNTRLITDARPSWRKLWNFTMIRKGDKWYQWQVNMWENIVRIMPATTNSLINSLKYLV